VWRSQREPPPCAAVALALTVSHPRQFQEDEDRVESWTADDFDPWKTSNGHRRVLRYAAPNGWHVMEAEWLTNFSIAKWAAGFLPHRKKPLGDRESGLQRRQEPLRHGAHLPP